MTKLLIIPDFHAHPSYHNHRFKALGEFVLDQRPDVLICLGDGADMSSLCSYDKGTKGFEGRRYQLDMESFGEAMDNLEASVLSFNKRRARQSKKQYKPRKVYLLGNHEARIGKLLSVEPRLEGTIGYEDLELEKRGWEVHGYGRVVNIEGFACSHNLPSGVSGRPVGGANMASRLLSLGHCSSIVGHSHILDGSERTTYLGTKVMSLSAGCYVHPEYREDWCVNTRDMWWLGVNVINVEYPGYGPRKEYTMKEIESGLY